MEDMSKDQAAQFGADMFEILANASASVELTQNKSTGTDPQHYDIMKRMLRWMMFAISAFAYPLWWILRMVIWILPITALRKKLAELFFWLSVVVLLFFGIAYPTVGYYCSLDRVHYVLGKPSFCEERLPSITKRNNTVQHVQFQARLTDQAEMLTKSAQEVKEWADKLRLQDDILAHVDLAEQRRTCGAHGVEAGRLVRLFAEGFEKTLQLSVDYISDFEEDVRRAHDRSNVIRHLYYAYHWHSPEEALFNTFYHMQSQIDELIHHFSGNTSLLLGGVQKVTFVSRMERKSSRLSKYGINGANWSRHSQPPVTSPL